MQLPLHHTHLHTFASTSENTVLRAALLPPRRGSVGFWAPLMGFFKDASPSTTTLRVHSRFPGARDYHFPSTFRPCRSSRLRRFTPRIVLRVYCAPQPTMRFAWFQAVVDSRRRSTLPTGVHTLRSFPLRGWLWPSPLAEATVHRTTIPSRRCSHLRRNVCVCPTTGIQPTAKSVAQPQCCHFGPARCSLGLPRL
jgi:hypothetical protein